MNDKVDSVNKVDEETKNYIDEMRKGTYNILVINHIFYDINYSRNLSYLVFLKNKFLKFIFKIMKKKISYLNPKILFIIIISY